MPAGEVLCREGETGHEFFVIVEGKTDVTSKGKRVATRGNGDFVGEIALLEDTKPTATVTAKTPLRLFVLTRQDFRRLVNENPSVERKVMQALARRVVELSSDPTLAWLRRRGGIRPLGGPEGPERFSRPPTCLEWPFAVSSGTNVRTMSEREGQECSLSTNRGAPPSSIARERVPDLVHLGHLPPIAQGPAFVGEQAR